MSLCLSVTLSAAESKNEFKINETVYIENGTDFVALSCGDVPQAAVAIEWFIYNNTEWVKVLKFYHNKSVNHGKPRYLINFMKYDSGLFMCHSVGGSSHTYTTMLQVVGKSLLIYLFTLLTLAILTCLICLKSKDIFRILNGK